MPNAGRYSVIGANGEKYREQLGISVWEKRVVKTGKTKRVAEELKKPQSDAEIDAEIQMDMGESDSIEQEMYMAEMEAMQSQMEGNE